MAAPSTDKTGTPLMRVIGLPTGILLVAGLMIGSGVFKKIAPMSASLMNQSYIVAAWIIAGLIALVGAFIIAGLATMTTESGGIYEYLRLSINNFFSFLYGWTVFTIIGSGSIAALSFVFAQSLNTLLHVPEPFYRWRDISIGHSVFPFAASGIKIVAVLAICLLTWLNYRGTKKGTVLNNVVTAAKVTGIALLIILGLSYHGSADLVASNRGTAIQFSNGELFSALFAAMLSAFWAYDGWYALSFATGEIKNPRRNVPIAIVTGLAVAMLLYVLLNYSFTRVLSLHDLAHVDENKIAAAVAAEKLMGSPGRTLISVLIAISTFSALNACIIVYPRLYFRMAQENFFFRPVANIHRTFRTPGKSLIVSMCWSSLLVISGTFDLLTNLIIFASFFFNILLAVGLMRMKRKKVIVARVPGYPVTSIIMILFSTALLINTVIVQTWQSLVGLCLVLTGVPFYYYFQRRTSPTETKL